MRNSFKRVGAARRVVNRRSFVPAIAAAASWPLLMPGWSDASVTITHSNTNTMMSASDWGGTAPAAGELGLIYNPTTISNANLAALTLDGNVTLDGLIFSGLGTNAILSDPGNYTLTLETSGINASNTGTNVTINAPIALGASESVSDYSNGSSTIDILTLNGPISELNAGTSLTWAAGGGFLVLGGNNTYSGVTNINGGTLQISAAANLGSGASGNNVSLNSGTATLEVTSSISDLGSNRTLSCSANGSFLVDSGAALGLSGPISTSTNTTLTKSGAGTLNFVGSSTLTGTLNLSSGVTNIATGSLSGLTTGTLTLRAAAGAGGILNLSNSSTSELSLLNFSIGTTSLDGGVYQSAGTATVTTFNLANRGFGFYQLSGGTLATGSGVAATTFGNTGTAIYYQSGGTFSTTNQPIISVGGSGIAVLDITGGTFTTNLASSATTTMASATGCLGILTVGGGSVSLSPTQTGGLVLGAAGATSTAIVNLNSGTLETNGISTANTGGLTAQVNFNGGTLKSGTTTPTLIANSSQITANVFSGGATIDTTNSSATISQPLVAPAGSGVSGTTIAVSSGGSGYIGAPLVTISGGTGATAIANMVSDGSGNGTYKVASITITSPGIGVTSPVVTFTGGGYSTAATAPTVSTASNVSGGLTLIGGNTLTLSGTSTYTGSTIISAGTLALSSSSSNNIIPSSSLIDVGDTSSHSTAKLDINGITATNYFQLQSGQQLSGFGSVVAANSSRTVTALAGSTIEPGGANGSTIGTLTSAPSVIFSAGSTFTTAIGPSSADELIVNGTGHVITLNGATLQLLELPGVVTGQNYAIMSDATASSITGTFAGITFGTPITSNGYTYTVTDSGTEVDVNFSSVPEPGTLGLVAIGGGLMLRRNRRRSV